MQAPNSVLLQLDSSARSAERVRLARQLSEAFDAEVKAMYLATPFMLRFPMAVEGSTEAFSMLDAADRSAKEKAKAMFMAASEDSPRLQWLDAGRDAVLDFRRRALYCDLLLLGQTDPKDSAAAELPRDFVSDLLIDSGKPAFIVPYAGNHAGTAQTVLVAWKESREAARAVSASLPWLRHAKKVHVVGYGVAQDAPLQALQAYLAEQGISATVHHGGPNEGEPGEMMLSLAADLGADLLVMGCYGHNRAREWVLGGATRSILEAMTVPVLMVH